MLVIDPAWAGKVQFYELLFGTWTVYIVLVLMWEKVLRAPLAEWRYVLMNIMGAGAFLINHYFQYSPWGLQNAPVGRDLLTLYTVVFLATWWWIGVRGQDRSIGWKFAAFFGGAAYTVAFIAFEQLARLGVDRYAVNEFWFMLGTFLGFIGVTLWRGRRST